MNRVGKWKKRTWKGKTRMEGRETTRKEGEGNGHVTDRWRE